MYTTGEELLHDRIQNLWENTDFSSTLFEVLVGYAVIAADFDGNIIAFNEGARQIYGYASTEMVGNPCYRLSDVHLILEEIDLVHG